MGEGVGERVVVQHTVLVQGRMSRAAMQIAGSVITYCASFVKLPFPVRPTLNPVCFCGPPPPRPALRKRATRRKFPRRSVVAPKKRNVRAIVR